MRGEKHTYNDMFHVRGQFRGLNLVDGLEAYNVGLIAAGTHGVLAFRPATLGARGQLLYFDASRRSSEEGAPALPRKGTGRKANVCHGAVDDLTYLLMVTIGACEHAVDGLFVFSVAALEIEDADSGALVPVRVLSGACSTLRNSWVLHLQRRVLVVAVWFSRYGMVSRIQKEKEKENAMVDYEVVGLSLKANSALRVNNRFRVLVPLRDM